MAAPANDVAVVHYNEIALKLGHRPMFVTRLVQNVRTALDGLPVHSVRAVAGRLVVSLGHAAREEVVRRIVDTPGVANVVCGHAYPAELAAVERALAEALGAWRPRGSFRVTVKRADKSFPIKSPEVGRRLGAIVTRATGAPVDLKAPDTTIYVEILPDAIYLSLGERAEGCGGLPVSTGGRVALLLSGGIDSPVAGLRMMRRGCRVDAIHFHSVPYLDGSSRDKARALSAVLARGQGVTRLSLVAFGEIQSEVVRSVPRPLRVVLYRRMMMRIASRIARKDGATALVTGESLGQVASQTLANLTVIERAASLPVLRPLVGMDKQEISDYAERAGTFAISIQPDQDCCTLFVPKHPATAASEAEVREAEQAVGDLDARAEAAVETRILERLLPDWEAASTHRAAEG